MKKQTSPFTAELTRQLRLARKNSSLIINNHNGVIYAACGYFAAIVTADEYDRFVRPVTNRDPGTYRLRGDDLNDAPASVLDVSQVVKSALEQNKGCDPLTPCPLSLDDPHGRLCLYRNDSTGNTHAFRASYTAIFSGCTLIAASPLTPAIVLYNGNLVGLVMPVKLNTDKPTIGSTVRAIRAFYNDAPATTPAADTAALRAELDKANARAKSAEQQAALDRKASADKIAELEKALESLRSALATAATTAPAPAPTPTTPPALICDPKAVADKLAALPGVTTTIKGAKSSVPIVWLSGNVKAHRAAIEKAGGKWSTKRAAYYVRCA